MKLYISRMSRILPILSILILGGFQTTNALEYLITDTLGGTTQTFDITYEPNTGIKTVTTYVYLKYTTADTAGRGTGFLSGSLVYGSSDQTIAYLNGTPGSATTQAGVYTVQNAKANGTAGTGWNATSTPPITGSLSTDLSLLTATYAGRLGGNAYGTTSGTTYYLYLATATLTVDTSISGTTNIAASNSIDWTGNAGSAFPTPTSDSFFITVNAVPEPTTYALAAISCVALGVVGRRKTRKIKKQEIASV
jgi:hypothetical protein